MAHFAKLRTGNKVEKVEVVSNDIATDENSGIDFLNNLYGTRDVWKQTSFNTRGGQHLEGGTPLRKNYAGVGFSYDQTKDAFISPQPHPSWTLDEDTCLWEAPVAHPDDGEFYNWNEETTSWDAVY